MIGTVLRNRIGHAIGAIAAAALALLGAWVTGRPAARLEAKAAALRHTLTALQTRQRIDDDLDHEPDLSARARRAGLLRDDTQ